MEKTNFTPVALRILKWDLGRQQVAVETGKQAAEGHHALSLPYFFGLGEKEKQKQMSENNCTIMTQIMGPHRAKPRLAKKEKDTIGKQWEKPEAVFL